MAVKRVGSARIPVQNCPICNGNEAADSIERIAVELGGKIGSLYNAMTDNVVGRLPYKAATQFTPTPTSVRCDLIDKKSPEFGNLLRFVGISHHLRLSILTGMCSASGIASLINDQQIFDESARLLHVYQTTETEYDAGYLNHQAVRVDRILSELSATHVITKVLWGIHFVIVMKVPPDLQRRVDNLLEKFKNAFLNLKSSMQLSSEDQAFAKHIIITVVYSNIYTFTKINNITSIYETFCKLQNKFKQHGQLKYILTPIQQFQCGNVANVPKPVFYQSDQADELENYLIRQYTQIQFMRFRVNSNLCEFLQGKCKKELQAIKRKLDCLQGFHLKLIDDIRIVVLKIREKIGEKHKISEVLNSSSAKRISEYNQQITCDIENVESKATLLDAFEHRSIQYIDMEDVDIPSNPKEEIIRDMLMGNDSNILICFATDALRNGDPNDWMKCYSEMMDEQRKNPNLRIVYADFTHSTYKPSKIQLYMSPPTHSLVPTTSASLDFKNLPRTSSLQPTEPVDDTINILLLGESGVGKSTFINAFANYLHFHSLHEAQRAKPIVVIPVSFLLTINDDFDEKVIKFGDIDTNEYHNDNGQSVTQSCKCYVFNISNKKTLRIIDTPGFGDTRGCDQDDLKMKNIFSFLNNFDRIHAVCLLLTPEVARLNQYFRSLCIQLFEYFGDEITDRFVFCFTNARSTFFAPGNTRPLVNAVLSSVCGKRVQCEKTNTFCFDSEAFRYLVAVQAKVEFEEAERSEFEQSWLKSTVESKRFRDWLCERQAYRRDVEWKSMEDAKFQIEMLVRPIVETVRNCLRNIILYDSDASLVLSAKAADPSTTICYRCSYKSRPERCGKLWILSNHLHDLVNTCAAEEQKPVQYRLTYISASHVTMESMETLNYYQKLLCKTASKFSVFLKENISDQFIDPFLNGIAYIIDEERFVCDKQPSSDLNKQLLQRLKEWKKSYEKSFYERKSMDVKLDLSNIYELIASVKRIPMVQHQLDAIRTHQWHVIEQNQHNIDTSEVSSKRMSKNNFRGLQLT